MKVYLSTLLRTILIYFESEKNYEVHLLHQVQVHYLYSFCLYIPV